MNEVKTLIYVVMIFFFLFRKNLKISLRSDLIFRGLTFNFLLETIEQQKRDRLLSLKEDFVRFPGGIKRVPINPVFSKLNNY